MIWTTLETESNLKKIFTYTKRNFLAPDPNFTFEVASFINHRNYDVEIH